MVQGQWFDVQVTNLCESMRLLNIAAFSATSFTLAAWQIEDKKEKSKEETPQDTSYVLPHSDWT